MSAHDRLCIDVRMAAHVVKVAEEAHEKAFAEWTRASRRLREARAQHQRAKDELVRSAEAS